MTKQYYSLPVPLQACLDSHKFAWIPQNDHIGSVRVDASGGSAKKCETVKQVSTLSKVPASMAPNELPQWSPRSNGSLSDRTNTSIWLHHSISTWGPPQTLKRSSKCALHWFMVAPHGHLESKATENHRKPVPRCAKNHDRS